MWSEQDTCAGNGKKGKGKTAGFNGSLGLDGGSDKEGQSSDGTPVELVYVPPFESNYSLGIRDDDHGGYFDEDEYKEPEDYQDTMSRKTREGAAWDVYHHGTGSVGSVGLSDGTSILSPSTAASIPMMSSPTPDLPSVVVDDHTTTSALSSSGLVTSRGNSKTGNRQWSSVDEEYGYDFFGGPDLGEDYYYARRNSRGHDGVVPTSSSGGFSSERQRERERERRTILQGGEERQSRSRSRSQSRTPSPAFISAPTAPAPTASNGQVLGGRKRSDSASATPSGSFTAASLLANDFLSLPSQRGRTVTQPQSQSQSLFQPQTRGRSSTRTASSSSSWEGNGGSSVGSSPMGSLSPDRLVRADVQKRETEKDREKARGRERRGRERTSEEVPGAKENESTASSGVHAGSGSSSTSTTRNAGGANGVVTDSKISSTTSSCSSSMTTVMGPPPTDTFPVNISPINKDQEQRTNFSQQQEVTYMRPAEEEQRRKLQPTPSSSRVFEERAAIDQKDGNIASGTTFLNTAELAPSISPPPTPPSSPMLLCIGVGHSRSSSYSESASTALPSPSKLRPPPLIPPPPLLAKPSTSFTAVSSSSSPIISKGLASPTTASLGEHTIVAKAVDIVSSAGAFLGLWQHSSIPGDK